MPFTPDSNNLILFIANYRAKFNRNMKRSRKEDKGTDTGTNTQTQYEMWFDPSFNTITVDGFDQTNSFPMGLFYPVQLTPDNIDPNNLITLDVTDPYPWAITVYADATTLVKGDTAGGQYPYLWAPDVQGGN